MMDEQQSDERRGWAARRDVRRGRTIGGVILIVLGGMFLLENFYPWFRFEDYWPVILIVIGIALIVRPRL